MVQTDIATKEFNVSGCRARHRTSEVADCLSHTDVFIFCPFVLFFGGEKFCCHPNRNENMAQTEKLLNS